MSQQIMSRYWHRMVKSTTAVSRESWQLVKGVAKQLAETRTLQFRQVLLTQARQPQNPNYTAARILQWDKEIGLIQYYGVTGYMREKKWLSLSSWQSSLTSSLSSSSSSSSPSKDDSTTPNAHTNTKEEKDTHPNEATPNVAQVAFMVTSSMRTELTERLGYEAADIRKLTPVQASLILQNDLHVQLQDRTERLANLVQAHHDAVEMEANRQREIGDREREQEDERVRVQLLAKQQQNREQELQQEQEQSPAEQVVAASASSSESASSSSSVQQETYDGRVEEQAQVLSIGTGNSTSNTSTAAAELPKQESVPSSTAAAAAAESTPPRPTVRKNVSKFFASSNILHDSKDMEQVQEVEFDLNSTRGTVWYEIIEHTHTTGLAAKDDDDENEAANDKSIVGSAKMGAAVVALYKSQKEAEMGLETKQLFASRLAKDRGLTEPTSTFEIRPTRKDSTEYEH